MSSVKKRSDMVKKRYGKTTKGSAKKKKSKTKVTPSRIGGSIGIKIKRTF